MQTKLPEGALRKGVVVGSVVALAVLALTASLRLALPSLASNGQLVQVAQLPNVSGDCNVVGSGNSIRGGINCPKVQPNPPTVVFGQQTMAQRSDGTYEVTVQANLMSQIPVSLVYVSAEGADVIDFHFEPGMGGAFNYWYGKDG